MDDRSLEGLAVICGGYRCRLPGYMAWRFVGRAGISQVEGGLWHPDHRGALFYHPQNQG